MTEDERRDFLKFAESYKQRLSENKEEAKEFLIETGIFDKTGKLNRNYSDLCIPLGQA